MTRHLELLACLALCLLMSFGAQSSVASSDRAGPVRALVTAIDDPVAFSSPQSRVALARTYGAGATVAKIVLSWDLVAPRGSEPPASFDAVDPEDPAYRWQGFDALVTATVASGLEPLVIVMNAPRWATRQPTGRTGLDNWNVDPHELADFVEAAARRFSGRFEQLPRVRYWQVWNEPNLSFFLNPQLSTQLTQEPSCPFDPARVVSAKLYRTMVNVSAKVLHRIRRDNVVIAGGMSPFCGTAGVVATAPLLFMRKFLCMSAGPTPKPTCSAKVEFDVFGVHPYTAGGPTTEALRPDDVSIGDLPEVNRLLRAAVRAGHVVARNPVKLWVTEFGWDSRPPDPYAVPLRLHARWVAEALYRMWADGVTLVTWFGLRDEAANGRSFAQTIQSGLYFRRTTVAKDRAKPALTAFRFPFVAFPSGETIHIWGRTPWGRPGFVLVDRFSKSGWRHVIRVQTNRYGIFQRRVPAAGSGDKLRAKLPDGSWKSMPFSLERPPDLLVNPFGGPYDEVP